LTLGNNSNPHANYRLQADDVIILRVARPETGTTPATKPIEFVKDGFGEKWLRSSVSRFAIRVGDLQGRTIIVSANGQSFSAFAPALLEDPGEQNEGRKRLALTDRQWSEVRDNTDNRLEIQLEPRTAPDLIAAGDVVAVIRRYTLSFAMQGDGQGPEPFLLPRVETFRLPVDSRGYVAFPALTIPSGLTDVEAPKDSAPSRALRARLAATQDVLRVADPERSIKTQASLQTFAACLSEGTLFRFPDVTGQSDQVNRRCWEAGVSPHFGPSSQSAPISGLMYFLSVEPRSWWLVDEHGKRFELRLRDGDTIPDTALRERQRLTGRGFFNSFYSDGYLVVVPRRTIASDEEAPFYMRVGNEARSYSYRILPGDTVHVTRSEPKQAILKEGAR